MQVKTFNSYLKKHQKLYQEMYSLTSDNLYPNYFMWYHEKFLKGLKQKERAYVVALSDEGQLVGCALLKKNSEECKICTLYVHPSFRRKGIATKLMKSSIDYLGYNPLMTVSSRLVKDLKPLLKRFHFQLSDKIPDLYGKGQIEYIFNAPVKYHRIAHSFLSLKRSEKTK